MNKTPRKLNLAQQHSCPYLHQTAHDKWQLAVSQFGDSGLRLDRFREAFNRHVQHKLLLLTGSLTQNQILVRPIAGSFEIMPDAWQGKLETLLGASGCCRLDSILANADPQTL